MNQRLHSVDMLQSLRGPVKSVFAHAATLARHIEVEDTLSAVLTFESGALGVMQLMPDTAAGPEERAVAVKVAPAQLLPPLRLVHGHIFG